MTIYQVTPISTKQPGTWTSQSIQVTGEEGTKAVLRLLADGLRDEPPTSTIEWAIQKSDDNISWTDQVRTTTKGNDGVPYYKPPAMSVTIDGLIGKYVRATATTNARFRFGLEVEVI